MLLLMYQMLFASRLSTTPTRSLMRYAIFSQTGSPRLVDYLALYVEYRRKVSIPRTQRSIAQFGNRIEIDNLAIAYLADNLAIAYLRSYPQSSTAASWDKRVECFSQGTTAHYAQCGHRAIALATLRLLFGAFSRLSHAAALIPC